MLETRDIGSTLMLGDPSRPGYDACTGCRVCVLPCPVWINSRDNAMTLQGRAISLKNGAKLSELAESAEACILCGACEPVCPEGIDTVGMTLDLRLALTQATTQSNAGPLVRRARSLIDSWRPAANPGDELSAKTLFLPGPGYENRRDLIALIASLLGKRASSAIARDDGRDLSWAREAGIALNPARVSSFLDTLRGRSEIVLGDGLLLRELKLWRPEISVVSLGEALLRRRTIRSRLKSTDLLIIESRAYHSGGRRSAQFYTKLRDEFGCDTNLDLQRTAMATGWTALNGPHTAGATVRSDRQLEWILRQAKPQRVIVESITDLAAFTPTPDLDGLDGLEVLHLAQLAEQS